MVSRNGSTNGHKPDAAMPTEHELLWDGLPPAVTTALGQPLDPALVSQRKGRGGRVFDYLEGHTVIDQANRIFGYGGWGYELAGDVTLRRVETVDPQTGEIRTTSVYSAPVRVTVAGAQPRTDLGVHQVAEETADGHDTAMKGAVTDGMKRALRSFGARFGNGLYGDRAPAIAPAQPQSAPAQAQHKRRSESQEETLRGQLLQLADAQGFDEKELRAAVRKKTGKELDDLAASELTPLIEGAAQKLRQSGQAQVG